MSYPYGPESYPTFEQLENKYVLDQLRHAYYFGVHRAIAEKRSKFAERKIEFSLDGVGESDVYGAAEFGMYPDEATIEDKALAFVHALDYAMGDCDDELDHLFQDIFAILDDNVVSRTDVEDSDWYEYKSYGEQIESMKAAAASGSEFDYADSIAELEKKREEFAEKKKAELETRLAGVKDNEDDGE